MAPSDAGKGGGIDKVQEIVGNLGETRGVEEELSGSTTTTKDRQWLRFKSSFFSRTHAN